jgi:hypothetical protein
VPTKEFLAELGGDTEDCRPVVKTAGRAHAQHDLKVGFSPFVILVVRIIQVGTMEDEGDRFANIVLISVETYALEFDFHEGRSSSRVA